MFETAIADSLPKPAWLSETEKLWPQWKLAGPELQQAKTHATLLWIKAREDAELDIVGEGEQSRQHLARAHTRKKLTFTLPWPLTTVDTVVDTIGVALQHVPMERLFPCTNCGLAPMSRAVALKKLEALAQGAALARARYTPTGASE